MKSRYSHRSSSDVITRPKIDPKMGGALRVDRPRYTGGKLLGIATLHKSNMVPIFSAEDAIAAAKMRR